jgi:hypothetical protein
MPNGITQSPLSRRLGAALLIGGLLIGSAALSPALASPPGHAGKDQKGNSGQNGHGAQHDEDHNKGPKSRWESTDRSLIERYFLSHWSDGTPRSQGMPPGLAKKGKIPPGIAAQIQQGKRLPSGVGRPVPPYLLTQLGKYPGYDQLLVGNDMVLVDAVSRVIVDIFRNVTD